MPVSIEPLGVPTSALGEGPLWDAETETLRWIDIHRSLLHQWREPDGWMGAVALADTPGFLLRGPRSDLVLGLRTGIVRTRPPFGRFEPLTDPNGRRRRGVSRYNDAAVDARGRLWVGTTESAPDARDGALLRVDPDGSSRTFREGLSVPNGIGFSPDDRTMYLTITELSRIVDYDYDIETGTPTAPRDFVVDDDGLPDGLCVDSDGNVWSAKWAGGRVCRYDPSGRLAEEIVLPVRNVTSLAFGGPGLETLFVTTAEDDDPQHPSDIPAHAGVVFRVEDTGARGIPEPVVAIADIRKPQERSTP
ncbi:UNVERIFIED_CONTAM: SMP-30/gluconolactonase/LRE family protein [Microbacterium sp. SLM126]